VAIEYIKAAQNSIDTASTVAVDVYTVPDNKKAIIMAALVGNSDSSSQNINSVAIDGTLFANRFFLTDYSIPPEGKALPILEGMLLDAGEILQISATGGYLSVRFTIKLINA